jgi:hypothetical protein
MTSSLKSDPKLGLGRGKLGSAFKSRTGRSGADFEYGKVGVILFISNLHQPAKWYTN